MDIKIENYLSNEEMKVIAERIYTTKMEAEVAKVIEARAAGNLVDAIFDKIVSRYVSMISNKYEDDILMLCKSEIARVKNNIANYDDTINASIRYKLQDVSKIVIDEHADEIKSLVYNKILECCNEMVLLAFVGDIIRKLDLDKAVKEILKEYSKK